VINRTHAPAWEQVAPSVASPACRSINTSWDTLPLFAHVRIHNFSAEDKALMAKTLRVLTVQGTLYGNTSSEEQARIMRTALPSTPVLTYRNVYYAEPEDASRTVVAAHAEWQLKDASGKPLDPAGKLVYDMSVPAVQQFYAGVIANLSDSGWIDGAFGDSGCGRSPNWLPPAQQREFSEGQWNAAAYAQSALQRSCPSAAFVSNCPYVPRAPDGGSDPWPHGVKGVMIESWCSDFQTGVGGPGAITSFRHHCCLPPSIIIFVSRRHRLGDVVPRRDSRAAERSRCLEEWINCSGGATLLHSLRNV
jgi:hypothetical protein